MFALGIFLMSSGRSPFFTGQHNVDIFIPGGGRQFVFFYKSVLSVSDVFKNFDELQVINTERCRQVYLAYALAAVA